jgi:diaminopimelate epimerase
MTKTEAIPFTKAHGGGNDFLLTWEDRVAPGTDLPALARAICDRHTGIGADGWLLVRRNAIRLFNADGSEAEISGNGTRCAAAFLLRSDPSAHDLTIETGAGPKHLRVIETRGNRWLIEMDMGRPSYREDQIRFMLPLQAGRREVTILDVGNPQCIVFVDEFPRNWQAIGAEIESHPQFPKRTNVSFVRVLDEHQLEVRFFERGVGETLSSGTGSTGAAVAAILRKIAASPVSVRGSLSDLQLRWDDSVYLTGPAVIVATGEFWPQERA